MAVTPRSPRKQVGPRAIERRKADHIRINVEEDVAPIKTFIQDTNCIIMKRHGFTVLGRTVSEAYHRTCVLVSEIKRNIIVEMLCAANGKTPEDVTDEEMAYMATHGDSVMYPQLLKRKA